MTRHFVVTVILSMLSFSAGAAIQSAMAQDLTAPPPCPVCQICPPPPLCPPASPAPTQEQIEAVQKAMEAIQAAENKNPSPMGPNP